MAFYSMHVIAVKKGHCHMPFYQPSAVKQTQIMLEGGFVRSQSVMRAMQSVAVSLRLVEKQFRFGSRQSCRSQALSLLTGMRRRQSIVQAKRTCRGVFGACICSCVRNTTSIPVTANFLLLANTQAASYQAFPLQQSSLPCCILRHPLSWPVDAPEGCTILSKQTRPKTPRVSQTQRQSEDEIK